MEDNYPDKGPILVLASEDSAWPNLVWRNLPGVKATASLCLNSKFEGRFQLI